MTYDAGERLRDAHGWAKWLVHIIADARAACVDHPGLTEEQNWAKCLVGLLGVYRDFASGGDAAQSILTREKSSFAAVRSAPFRNHRGTYASAHEAAAAAGRDVRRVTASLGRLWRIVVHHLPEDADLDGGEGYNAYLISAAVESCLLPEAADEDLRQALRDEWPGFYGALTNDPSFAAESARLRAEPQNAKVWVGLSSVRPPASQPMALRERVLRATAGVDFESLLAELLIEYAKASGRGAGAETPPTPGTREAVPPGASSAVPVCPVRLRGLNEKPVVNGVETDPLEPGEYELIEILCAAWPGGTSLKELSARTKNDYPHIPLRRLKMKNPVWASVIQFPGGRNRGGYRIG